MDEHLPYEALATLQAENERLRAALREIVALEDVACIDHCESERFAAIARAALNGEKE